MKSQTDSLELAILQSIQGIFPRNSHVIDYAFVIKRLRKELKIVLNVDVIDQIIHIINLNVFDAQFQNPELQLIDKKQAKAIVSSNNVSINQEIGKVINEKKYKNKYAKIIDIILEEMNQFQEPEKFLKNINYDSRNNVWNHKSYSCKKIKLDSLIGRELSKEEFHIIAGIWFHYMIFADDMLSYDSYNKEKIKELKKNLSQTIKFLENKIQSHQHTLELLHSFKRFLPVSEISHKIFLSENKKELECLKLLEKRLLQSNGSELNRNNIQNQAYFSIFFIGELLGLSEPVYKKDGNPLLRFLDILAGWTSEGLETHKKISAIYRKYKDFKKKTDAKQWIEDFQSTDQGHDDLYFILEKFKSQLLQLSIKPNPLAIARDDQP